MAIGKRDEHRQPVLMGVSSVDGTTPIALTVDPTTKRLRVKVIGNEGNNASPDRAITRRDENRVPTMSGETNDANRTISPFSIESVNDGIMCEGA